MISNEFNPAYQAKLSSLAELITTGDKSKILDSKIIPDIKELLHQGADVNTQDHDGNTLLHYIASYNIFSELVREQNQSGNYDNVLDLPTLVSYFKPNPFIKNNFGFTASFLAACNENSKEHAMLLSYENAYSASKIGLALANISRIQVHTKYIDPETGIRIVAAAEQSTSFTNLRQHVASISRDLMG